MGCRRTFLKQSVHIFSIVHGQILQFKRYYSTVNQYFSHQAHVVFWIEHCWYSILTSLWLKDLLPPIGFFAVKRSWRLLHHLHTSSLCQNDTRISVPHFDVIIILVLPLQLQYNSQASSFLTCSFVVFNIVFGAGCKDFFFIYSKSRDFLRYCVNNIWGF